MAHVADTADTSTLLSSRHALSTGLYKFFHVLLCLCSTRKPCGNSQPNPANDPWHGNKSKIFQFPENTHTSLPFGRLQRRQAAIRAHHYVTLGFGGFGAEMKLFRFLLARVPLGSFKGTRTKAHEIHARDFEHISASGPSGASKTLIKYCPGQAEKLDFTCFPGQNPRISEPAKPLNARGPAPGFVRTKAHESQARKSSFLIKKIIGFGQYCGSVCEQSKLVKIADIPLKRSEIRESERNVRKIAVLADLPLRSFSCTQSSKGLGFWGVLEA